jgi:hypothetical protein
LNSDDPVLTISVGTTSRVLVYSILEGEKATVDGGVPPLEINLAMKVEGLNFEQEESTRSNEICFADCTRLCSSTAANVFKLSQGIFPLPLMRYEVKTDFPQDKEHLWIDGPQKQRL